jgi:hypothetical protein
MTPLRNPFQKKVNSSPLRDSIREWTRNVLGGEPPVTLTISEIDCGDPACPGLETIILVMREGEATQAVKVRKPMQEITQADIEDAMKFL